MVNYSLNIVAPILSGDANEVEVTAAAEDAYLHRLQAASVDKVWNGPCRNVRSILTLPVPFPR
jgi:hypothetical protein